jgi:hypothetical protein
MQILHQEPDELAALAAVLLGVIDPGAEVRYRHQLAREAYQAGVEAGLARVIDADEEAWRVAAGRVRVMAASPSRDEVEARRWSVRGEQRTRETFGRPHRDDYPGSAQERRAAA